MNISVVMATFNGEPYLEEQLGSILSQLQEGDELIVSDDGSTDGSRERLAALAATDRRVTLLDGPQRGAIDNFEFLLSHAKGAYIFLADQDDIWLPHKREAVVEAAEREQAVLVMHDAQVVDAAGELLSPSFFALRGTRTGLLHNLWKNGYIGCCMAFSAVLLPELLPFPPKIPMHDQWIGLQAQRHGKVTLLHEPLLAYRRHGGNVTGSSHGKLSTMLSQRAHMAHALLTHK